MREAPRTIRRQAAIPPTGARTPTAERDYRREPHFPNGVSSQMPPPTWRNVFFRTGQSHAVSWPRNSPFQSMQSLTFMTESQRQPPAPQFVQSISYLIDRAMIPLPKRYRFRAGSGSNDLVSSVRRNERQPDMARPPSVSWNGGRTNKQPKVTESPCGRYGKPVKGLLFLTNVYRYLLRVDGRIVRNMLMIPHQKL